jgi:hypothetical protein
MQDEEKKTILEGILGQEEEKKETRIRLKSSGLRTCPQTRKFQSRFSEDGVSGCDRLAGYSDLCERGSQRRAFHRSKRGHSRVDLVLESQ